MGLLSLVRKQHNLICHYTVLPHQAAMKITCVWITHAFQLRSVLFCHCVEHSGRLAKL